MSDTGIGAELLTYNAVFIGIIAITTVWWWVVALAKLVQKA
jgi:hypothetical protein